MSRNYRRASTTSGSGSSYSSWNSHSFLRIASQGQYFQHFRYKSDVIEKILYIWNHFYTNALPHVWFLWHNPTPAPVRRFVSSHLPTIILIAHGFKVNTLCTFSTSIIRLGLMFLPPPETSEQTQESRHRKMKIYIGLSVTLFFINPGSMRPDLAAIPPPLDWWTPPLQARILIIAVHRALTPPVTNGDRKFLFHLKKSCDVSIPRCWFGGFIQLFSISETHSDSLLF